MTFKKDSPEKETSEAEGAAETIREEETVSEMRPGTTRRIEDDEETGGEIIDQEGNPNPPEQDTNFDLVTKLASTSITPIAFGGGNTPERILIHRDDPKYAASIKSFEDKRIAEGSESYDTLLAVTERSDAFERLALIRIDSINRPTCEAQFAIGAADAEVHIAGTVSGNSNEDFVGQRMTDIAFGALRYSHAMGADHQVFVHATTGNDNVNENVKARLSQGHTPALSGPEYAKARHMGRSHDKDIYALGRVPEMPVNQGDKRRVSARNAGKGLVSWAGNAWREFKGFVLEIADKIQITLFGK